jgi:hypothetical protein
MCFFGLTPKSDSNFSRFFKSSGNDSFSSRDKKKIIKQAIRQSNEEQKKLVEKVERMYSN